MLIGDAPDHASLITLQLPRQTGMPWMLSMRRLLGESLWRHVKGSNSEPSELGPKHAKYIHDAFVHPKGVPLHFFCREAEASKVPK
jgi:hypothetical protein